MTFLMVQRMVEGRGFDRRWVPLDAISPRLVRAVIAAEDARFCRHHGFDIAAIQKAMRANRAGKSLRGGSTISQRSEEHTSELQSLMRISYAVFCLKKKKRE